MLAIIFPSDMFYRIFIPPMGIHVSMIYWSPMIDNWNHFALISAQWNFYRYSPRKCRGVIRIVLFRLARRLLWEWIGRGAGMQRGSNYRSTQRSSQVKVTPLPNFNECASLSSRTGGSLLVTDMSRRESLLDLVPNAKQMIREKTEKEGSQLGRVLARCNWSAQ